MRTELQASLQSCRSVDADAWYKLALTQFNSFYHSQDWFNRTQVVEVVDTVNTSFDSEGAFDDDMDDDDDQSEQFSESIEQEVEQEHAYIVMEGPNQDELGSTM